MATLAAPAGADPTTAQPDAPARRQPPSVPPASFRPSWDLDGTYLWLGPSGAAGYAESRWDSAFGADLAITRVREREALGLIGVDIGASRWGRGGGRVWVDGLVGTHLLGRMMGASLGPIVELSEISHPKLGGSIGLWGFAGISPFARLGAIRERGIFVEVGVHIALPVLRR